MGKTVETQMDFETFKKLVFKKPNCSECGTKVKIQKEKTLKGHGSCENENYIKQYGLGPISAQSTKEVYINQDIYEMEYKYRCPKCNKVYELNEL